MKTKEVNGEQERDDALEYYMRRCSELESLVLELKEKVQRLTWTLEEQD